MRGFAEMQKLIDILRITAGRELESNHIGQIFLKIRYYK